MVILPSIQKKNTGRPPLKKKKAPNASMETALLEQHLWRPRGYLPCHGGVQSGASTLVEDRLWPLTYRGHRAADWLALAARHLESLRRGPMLPPGACTSTRGGLLCCSILVIFIEIIRVVYGRLFRGALANHALGCSVMCICQFKCRRCLFAKFAMLSSSIEFGHSAYSL